MNNIHINPIKESDIPDKVNWYNDDEIAQFLHYEDKFTIKKSLDWLKEIENDVTRYENIIKVEENEQLVNIGVIGLFNIDFKNRKAGFYITIGNKKYQGKGLAKKSTIQFLSHCFLEFDLEKIYLYTDRDNLIAQKLYEKVGFTKEGLLRRELFFKNKFIDRYYYGFLKDEFFNLY